MRPKISSKAPIISLSLMAAMALVVHPVWGVTVEEWAEVLEPEGSRSRAPDQGLIHSSAKPILRILTCLVIENHCAIRMINVEQFQNDNNLVELDDNHIHSICNVNFRNKEDIDTYVSGTGEYNLQIYVFATNHLKFTGRSFHPDSIGKSFVMTFKDQKKRVETHVRSKVILPVITKIMLKKEPDNVWELLGEHLNTVREKNGLPLSSWCQSSSKLIPTVSEADSSDEYITLDRELVVRDPISKETHHGQTLNTLEERSSAWTDDFKAAEPILWEQIFQMLGKTTV